MAKAVLKKIWNQVPPDYYQKGKKKNFLQKLWHGGKWRVLKEFLNKDARQILDVGCAGGHLTILIQKTLPKAKVTGLDVYGKSIRFAQKRYKKIKFVAADAHNLPFKDKTFDTIVSSETLEHVVNPRKVFQEIRRCLKDDGEIIIEMDGGNRLFNSVWFFWTNFGPGKVWRGSHLSRFTADSLERMIIESGFKIKKKKFFNFGMAVIFKAEKSMKLK